METKKHCLKVWPEFYQRLATGKKRAEFRLNDRDFKEGDILKLQEWSPKNSRYSGSCMYVRVTDIVHGKLFGIPEGYCMMSFEPAENRDFEA